MNTAEFKVGDIWKWVGTGIQFKVVEVDEDGDAVCYYNNWIVRKRILNGEVVLIFRDGLSVAATPETFTKADLVAGKHVVETKSGDCYLILADDICVILSELSCTHSVKMYGWEKTETLFSDFGVVKVYEIAQVKGSGFSFGDLKVVWSSDKAELKAKLSELEQKKLEIEAEIEKLKEGL